MSRLEDLIVIVKVVRSDGCNPSRPVGYIEGWYVTEDHRHSGVGSRLLVKAEDWARSHRCVEMASDASLIISYPSVYTRRWATRLWTVVCITGSNSEKRLPPLHVALSEMGILHHHPRSRADEMKGLLI